MYLFDQGNWRTEKSISHDGWFLCLHIVIYWKLNSMLFTTGCHVHFTQSYGFNQVTHTTTYFEMKIMVCIFLGIEYHKSYVLTNT